MAVGGSVAEQLPVHTIFFGGGTPSLVPVEYYKRLFELLKVQFAVDNQAEISLEANPGTVDQQYLSDLKKIGFNRISFGMQSAHPQELALLERAHQFEQVIDAVRMSRRAGFDNLSVDLIYGLPDQTLDRWLFSLDCALTMQPEHISLYSLTVEDGTRLQKMVERGLMNYPEDDMAAEMYESSSELLAGAGYLQYEISNWKKADTNGRDWACRHNLQYWRYTPYLGFGAGAHGFANQTRTANQTDIAGYIRKIQQNQVVCQFPAGPAAQVVQQLDLTTQMGEFMMVGLRLTESGVSKREFEMKFNRSIEEVFAGQLTKLLKRELIEVVEFDDGEHMRIAKNGRLLGNQVFMEFIEED